MTELSHVATHVPATERDVWEAEAEEMNTSLSQYVQMMAIAGRKKFDRHVEPDKTRADLRRELGRLMKELEERDRTIKSLR
jgi:acetyl-CoA carboxylase carboxyltransferase component